MALKTSLLHRMPVVPAVLHHMPVARQSDCTASHASCIASHACTRDWQLAVPRFCKRRVRSVLCLPLWCSQPMRLVQSTCSNTSLFAMHMQLSAAVYHSCSTAAGTLQSVCMPSWHDALLLLRIVSRPCKECLTTALHFQLRCVCFTNKCKRTRTHIYLHLHLL
jgi:hypothetical protein